MEAQGYVLSGSNIYQYENYERRVKLNYAVGFMKLELEKVKNGK